MKIKLTHSTKEKIGISLFLMFGINISNAQGVYNSGATLFVGENATLFIPKTKKAEERNSYINENSDISSLERWFTAQAGEGSRNNMLLRYGYALVDKGYASEHIRTAILEFNHKLPKPLPIDEIEHTIMLSVAKKIGNKE